ncbi:hypothetical protein pdam_00005212 [Pocillopora damicornis]|uniref:Uncharacterized protein n=1 Tax=Pocillopora damicornis TaxID=46731 RepID=A0A3M6T527_POCDA|nr:hypothetical protein pdam_00005212 [Pocillopora damicornis]
MPSFSPFKYKSRNENHPAERWILNQKSAIDLRYPHFLKLDEIAEKCPVFGKGVCPYGGLTDKLKDITGNCPAFKDRCPFKSLKTAGEHVDKLAQMRDKGSCKGRAAFQKLMKRVLEVSEEAERKSAPWSFPPNTCPIFEHDTHGKRIMRKLGKRMSIVAFDMSDKQIQSASEVIANSMRGAT